MANYEFFYGGMPYSLEPEYGSLFSGYQVPAGEIGSTTSVRTANQISEVTSRLNEGVKNVEVSLIQKEIFDQIPKQQIEEIARLSKLTGSEVSLHAPIVEPSGFTEQGWSEENRIATEIQLADVIERGHKLSPKGNIPITIHSSSIPGTSMIKEEGKKPVKETLIAVDRESGRLIPIKREKKYYPVRHILKKAEKKIDVVPGSPEGMVYEVEEELKSANLTHWDNKLSQLVFYKERGDELLRKAYPLIAGESKKYFSPEQEKVFPMIQNTQIYYENTRQTLNSLYSQAMKSAEKNPKLKKELIKASHEYTKKLKKATNARSLGEQMSFESDALQSLINNMREIILEKGIVPEVYTPVEEFAVEQASKTFGNVAFKAYKKFGNKAPIISIENPPYGGALSSGEEMKKLIEESRKKFVKKAEQAGYSKTEAERAAEKLIGATWDTAHITMMRQKGFSDHDIVEQAKKVAPFVKHVHMNDSLGGGPNDLPPGMGDAPLKEMLKEFEKAGFKGKKVFEGGAFAAQFQVPVFPYVLEGVGSPLYPMKMQPAWAPQQRNYGAGYYSSFIQFPDQHFSMYGSGFSGLPTELGGQIAGAAGGGRSRFSGTPTA